MISQKERFKLEEEWGRWLMSVKWAAMGCGEMGYGTKNALADRVDYIYVWMHRHTWDEYFADMVLRLMKDIAQQQRWHNCTFPSPPESLVTFLKSRVNAPIPLVDYT